MSRVALAILVVCGCYAPHPPQGAPCDDTHPCPTGQACVAGFCDGTPGSTGDASNAGDGPDAAPTPGDTDADGVPNASDNCPNTSNADQGNEDADLLGDKCDPCPIDATTPPSDPDGDGVSDSCDPRPTTAGDSIVLFEGFHGGVPSTWQVLGTATKAGDDVIVTGDANGRGALVPPISAPISGTVSMKGMINATVGNFDSAFSVAMPYNPGGDDGIYCELYAPNAGSATGRELDIYDFVPDIVRAKTPFAWQLNTPYTLIEKRATTAYSCTVNGMTLNATSNSAPPANKAAVFTYGVNAQVSWMLVVASQ